MPRKRKRYRRHKRGGGGGGGGGGNYLEILPFVHAKTLEVDM